MKNKNYLKYKKAFKWQYEAYPIFTSVYVKAARMKEKNKYYTDWFDFLNNFEDGHLTAFLPNKQILKIGRIAIKESMGGNGGYLKVIREIHEEVRLAAKLCLEARKKHSFSLSGWWPETQKALSHVANIIFSFDYTFDDFLGKLKERNPGEFEILNNSIKNTGFSFIDQANERLLKLCKKYNFEELFKIFINEFGWFQNSYQGVFKIKRRWLKNYLKDLTKKNQAALIEKGKINLPKKYKIISELANEIIIFRDDKKRLLLLAVDLMNSWIKNLCSKNGWKFKHMRWLTVDEILEIIKKRNNKNLIRAVEYSNANRRVGMMTKTGYDNVSEKLWKSVLTLYYSGNEEKKIKGVAASRGLIRGRVKIIRDARKDAKKFLKNDILVTSMTRPEFLPLMIKASAFITDEGGISSHAAIIAREMKKPCIIGTKIATKVLKDGQMVEVDANNGIVKIIKL